MPEPISPARRRWIFVAAMIVSFVSAIEVTIVATAMPTIVGALGDFDLFSWVFTAYLLTQGVTVPIYGRLCDFYGRKRVLYFGLVFFVLGSLLCGFAWSMPTLIAFRVVQGLGGGALATVSQTMVSDLYPPAERAKVQGYISSTFATAAFVGPIAGAFIVAHWPWSWVFWVNLPLCALIVLMLEMTFVEKVELHSHEIDYLGSLLMALATFFLMYALTRVATLPASTIALLLISALVAFVLLLLQEKRAREPILPLDIWRNRIVILANAASGSIGGMQMAVTAFLPAFIQGVLGEPPIRAGLALTALSFAWPTGGFIAGRALLHMSYRRSSSLGSIVLISGATMMAFVSESLGANWALASSFLIGLGMGLTNMGFFVAIQASIEWHQRGLVTATFNYARIIGQSIGTAIFGGIVNAALASRIQGEGDLASRILDPSLRESMSPEQYAPLLDAFGGGVHVIFEINIALAVLTGIWALGLPKGLGVRGQMRK
jgi:EmrB/QacA subfamily drug resistance transporter